MSSNNFVHLILVGATASGKGTLSNLIMNAFDNFMHISMGDILRLHAKLNTPLGKQVEKYLNSGALVPDELIVDSMLQALKKARNNHWILDGFPRNINQAKILHDIGNDPEKNKDCVKCAPLTHNKVDAVFNLIIPDELIIKRISNRWVHLPSGRIYNVGFQEPRVKWKDDITGQDLVQRADDHPEVVAERLKIHRKQTEPILRFYRDHCVDILDLQSEHIDKIWPIVNAYLQDKDLKLNL